MLTMQDALTTLSAYWTERGCLTWQPFNTEVGAGTMNPATVLRVLGPEPWRVAYVEPSVRPDDSRYGLNPNRLQTHTQFQVILKPEPGNPQELYLESLAALGIDLSVHDVRFVEDNWAQPAIGAWGLGWEVWLNGLEITQFTYFQQVGGQNLDPIPVELTYGIERILMAVQGKTHFKDIIYAVASDGSEVTYGEIFGQQEYEMSKYYLDDASIAVNRSLYDGYITEATRMIEANLPVPAHSYVLKSSHAFNVLDARGAISTTERAKAFSTMRRLMRDTASLWIERRTELGFPLLRDADLVEAAPVPAGEAAPESPQTFVFEIGIEEMPPAVVTDTITQVRDAVAAGLSASRLECGDIAVDGTPRRIVVTVQAVASREADHVVVKRGPRWSAAFEPDGTPTKGLLGFARGQHVAVEDVIQVDFGGQAHAGVRVVEAGRDAVTVLAELTESVVRGLRSDKNMRWNDPSLAFSRPVRWLLALWGPIVVPARISRLAAGRTTQVHRQDTRPMRVIGTADDLLPTLAEAGLVVTFADRRKQVVMQATRLAASIGGHVDVESESALIDQITNLIEEPVCILGSFDERYLELPERVLTTVMRKHQRYLPVRGSDGRLLARFVTTANGECDPALVRAGNESVLRARFEDALFFWNADLREGRADAFLPGLEALTFEDRLGSIGQRARRIGGIAKSLAPRALLTDSQIKTLDRAAELAKFDLATQLVTEMSSLAGFMAREYSERMGETPQVADALYEMEQPHTTGDPVPHSVVGSLLAVADRAELLVGMFALGSRPTGSSDPFGLRRAALGLVRILREAPPTSGLGSASLAEVLDSAAARLADDGVAVPPGTVKEAAEFAAGRLCQLLRDEGVPAKLVEAIAPLALVPGQVGEALVTISQWAPRADFRALVTALVRVERIVPTDTRAALRPELLGGAAEHDLVAIVDALPARPATLAEFVPCTSGLAVALNRFFDDVLVLDPDPDLRGARLGLLASILNRAPRGINWRALESSLGA